MKKKKTIAIIGGGVGGLATAALLAKDGYAVHLFEKNKHLGGRANILKEKGFTFDLGPSWYLMPDVFERFFNNFEYSADDLIDLKPIAPQYRIFFEDRSQIDIPREPAKARVMFEKIEKGAGKKFDQFLKESKFKYDLAIKDVLYKNADSIFDFFSWNLLKHGRELHALQSMQDYVGSFFKNERLQQILQYTLVFLGGSPANTPALYSLMTHVDFNLGVYYPMGGFYKVVESMVRIAKEQGVQFHTGAEISQILVTNGKATGIKVGKKTIPFDAIVANADYAHTESLFSDESQKMFDQDYWEQKTLAPSAFLLFLGIKGDVPDLLHHNISFGKNWMSHFEEIFTKPEWPQNPSLYINVPSKTDPSVAPKGHHNMMVLVPVAAGLQDSEAWKKGYAEFILGYMKEQLGIDIKDSIVYQKIFSVSDFAATYNSYKGNALGGLNHTLMQTGPFRPPNKHKYVKNLFFAGANTVPGIGVPPSLISAELARDRVRSYFG